MAMSKNVRSLVQLAGMCLEGHFIDQLPRNYEMAQYGFLYGLYKAAEASDGEAGANAIADAVTQYMTFETFPIW